MGHGFWRAGGWAMLPLLAACGADPLNSPYPAGLAQRNVMFSAFEERPKYLDPARAYSSNEYDFIAQIYEPPLQYHYLKRPYQITTLTAGAVPQPRYFSARGEELPASADAAQVAYSVYEIHIKPGIHYQPHPAFARDASGRFLYHALTADAMARVRTLADFPRTGTRELVAADYVYQIKRLAHPHVHSPILGLMAEYIVGMKDYAGTLEKDYTALTRNGEAAVYLDLTRHPLEGVEEVDRYTYRIKIRGKYPQFIYWLAMPFFSPMPPEADRFYTQPGMEEKNITLQWYPVGTGAYMLTENNPNLRMVLERNPNHHEEFYPAEGEPGDARAGLLADAGKRLPFIDKAIYSLEKESIPYWNKFLQGYYDASGIGSDNFDQAVRAGGQGEMSLTEEMEEKGISLQTAVAASTFYLGFNMRDPVVGGFDTRARKLRQAISIAVDYEEYIAIFMNGRGIAAQGPLPPGIFGFVDGARGVNPYVYEWKSGAPQRKSIDTARALLAEAGYPYGVDQKSGQPLVLYFDVPAGGADDKARLDWFRKQFQKLDVQLVVRNTDYNRFQDKMLKGTAQIFMWGWNADYPDPENFLFLLYGPNAKAAGGGENASNYANPEFDRLFEQMKNMDNGPARQAIIDQMIEVARRDAPWIWGVNPKGFSLRHAWYMNTKPNLMANNTLKYLRIEPRLRTRKQAEWNGAVVWPITLAGVLLIAGTLPAIAVYRRRQRATLKARGEA